MEQRHCKNKKCQRILPDGYKYKYCENCRNERAKKAKDGFEMGLGVALSLAAAWIIKDNSRNE